MTPETPELKKGRGRPRGAGGRLPTMTIRLTKGGEFHLEALKALFPEANRSMLVRTAFDIAVQNPVEFAKEVGRSYEDHGPLGVFRSAIGLAHLTSSTPICVGVATFRVEPGQHSQYRVMIGQQSPALILEASLRLFRKKAEKHSTPE